MYSQTPEVQQTKELARYALSGSITPMLVARLLEAD